MYVCVFVCVCMCDVTSQQKAEGREGFEEFRTVAQETQQEEEVVVPQQQWLVVVKATSLSLSAGQPSNTVEE